MNALEKRIIQVEEFNHYKLKKYKDTINADIYIISNTDLLYKTPKENYSVYDEIKLRHMIDIKSEKYMLPLNLIKYKDNVKGFTMKYLDGETLEDYEGDMLINKFVSEFESLQRSALFLYNNKIIINDIHPQNIIVKKDELFGIDADGYLLSSREKSEKYISTQLSIAVMYYIFSYRGNFNFIKYEIKGKDIKEWMELIIKDKITDIGSIINILYKYCTNYDGEESINTINQLRYKVRKINNSKSLEENLRK